MDDIDPVQPELPRDSNIPGLIARRPFVLIALFLILGIVLYPCLPASPVIYMVLGSICTCSAIFTLQKQFFSTLFICLATFAGATAVTQLYAYYYPSNDIALFSGDLRRLGQFELYIKDSPRIISSNFGQSRPLPPKQTALAHVTRIKTWEGWIPATGDVLVQISEPHPELAAGQTVRVLAMIDRPAPAMNPGQFDWARYYRDQRILSSIHIAHSKNIQIISDQNQSLPWLMWWRQVTRQLLADGFTSQQSLDHALLRALVLGDSDPELRDVQEAFRATGTSHHLAISGAHIAVMGGMIFLCFRLLRLPPAWAWWAGMIFVVAYGLAALPSPPVVRSVLMWLVVGSAILLRRSWNMLNMLAIVIVAMLFYQPLDLYNAGFQLTFGTVAGLIILAPYLAVIFGAASDEHVTLQKPSMFVFILTRVGLWIDNKIVFTLAAGLTAWMVSLPIIATHFSQLNPWAIVAGILLSPFVLFSLVAGLIKIPLCAIWPGKSTLFASIAQQPVRGMRHVVEWLTNLPLGDVPLPAPPLWVSLIFYSSLVLFVIRWKQPGIRLLARISPAFALLLMFVLPYHTTITYTPPTDELRVTLLNIGAGQAAVIEPPSHRVVMIDAGSLSLADPLRKCIAPFLRNRGITNIDTIAISHANTDHFSAVAELVDGYDVREVLTATGFDKTVEGNGAGIALLESLNTEERPPRGLKPGEILPLGKDTSMEVLWPPVGTNLPANDQSLVLRLTHAGKSILFTGDIQEDGLRGLIAMPDKIKSDILIAPHHGSSESITPLFLSAVAPTAIVASNDQSLSRKQLNFNDMANAPLYRTHTSGAITIHITSTGDIHIETMH